MIGNGAGGNVRIDRRKSGHGLTRRPARGRTCASPDPHLDRCGVVRSESRCASCRWTSAVRARKCSRARGGSWGRLQAATAFGPTLPTSGMVNCR